MRGKVLGVLKIAAVALMIGLFAAPQPAHALLLNFGLDITTNANTLTVSSGFFDGASGDANGCELKMGEMLTLHLNMTTLLSGYTIDSAVLFVDAFNIINTNPAVFIEDQDLTTPVGTLADNGPNSLIPVLLGPPTTQVASAFSSETDNTFFTLTLAQRNQLATDNAYTIVFKNTSQTKEDKFKIDGINLQVTATPVHIPLPEPASMALLGFGMLGMIGRGKRHDRLDATKRRGGAGGPGGV